MSLLLDTHVALWAMTEPLRISRAARGRIADQREPVFVSAVSVYEIEFKALRDPSMPALPVSFIEMVRSLEFDWLGVDEQDCSRAARLTGNHRDPWDRILAAQAIGRKLTLVTADRAIQASSANWDLEFLW